MLMSSHVCLFNETCLLINFKFRMSNVLRFDWRLHPREAFSYLGDEPCPDESNLHVVTDAWHHSFLPGNHIATHANPQPDHPLNSIELQSGRLGHLVELTWSKGWAVWDHTERNGTLEDEQSHRMRERDFCHPQQHHASIHRHPHVPNQQL